MGELTSVDIVAEKADIGVLVSVGAGDDDEVVVSYVVGPADQ